MSTTNFVKIRINERAAAIIDVVAAAANTTPEKLFQKAFFQLALLKLDQFVASERVGEPRLVREVLPEVVGGEELSPVMELVDDLELGLREPEEGRDE